MPDLDPSLRPRSAFAHLPMPSATTGIVVTARDELALVRVVARKGQRLMLARHISERFGLELPSGPHRNSHGTVALLGTGPDSWLVSCDSYDGGPDRFAMSLANVLAGVASVVNCSDVYGVLRMTGAGVCETLCTRLPIDLHPRAFGAGAVASTAAAHVGLMVWRLENVTKGLPVFELAVPRSFADSFWHAFIDR